MAIFGFIIWVVLTLGVSFLLPLVYVSLSAFGGGFGKSDWLLVIAWFALIIVMWYTLIAYSPFTIRLN